MTLKPLPCNWPECEETCLPGYRGYTRRLGPNYCDRHWRQVSVRTRVCEACAQPGATQICGPCRRQVCADCFGPEWNVLACRDCREKARAQAS